MRNRAKRSEKLRLLQDVSALFQPASMAAIMGPSGSGTSLPFAYEDRILVNLLFTCGRRQGCGPTIPKTVVCCCAGKTTLLDVLAGRKTQGEQAGRILFAGQKATQAFLKRFTGDKAEVTGLCMHVR